MATFGRLLGFLRPYRWGLIWSGLLAVVALTMTAAIPWLTGRAIDQMREGDQSGLNALAFAVLGAGVEGGGDLDDARPLAEAHARDDVHARRGTPSPGGSSASWRGSCPRHSRTGTRG